MNFKTIFTKYNSLQIHLIKKYFLIKLWIDSFQTTYN